MFAFVVFDSVFQF